MSRINDKWIAQAQADGEASEERRQGVEWELTRHDRFIWQDGMAWRAGYGASYCRGRVGWDQRPADAVLRLDDYRTFGLLFNMATLDVELRWYNFELKKHAGAPFDRFWEMRCTRDGFDTITAFGQTPGDVVARVLLQKWNGGMNP
jgi:hypothetical protein